MSDILVRAAIVIALVVVAALGALGARRRQQPIHPIVDLRGTDLPDGVVLFTSTDCSGCDEARSGLAEAGVEYREVTWELEGRLLEEVGVEAVPLAVFRDANGNTVAQIAGAPRGRAVSRALAAVAL